MTKNQAKHYFNDYARSCPYCSSGTKCIEYDIKQYDDDTIWLTKECQCGARWDEEFRLVTLIDKNNNAHSRHL